MVTKGNESFVIRVKSESVEECIRVAPYILAEDLKHYLTQHLKFSFVAMLHRGRYLVVKKSLRDNGLVNNSVVYLVPRLEQRIDLKFDSLRTLWDGAQNRYVCSKARKANDVKQMLSLDPVLVTKYLESLKKYSKRMDMDQNFRNFVYYNQEALLRKAFPNKKDFGLPRELFATPNRTFSLPEGEEEEVVRSLKNIYQFVDADLSAAFLDDEDKDKENKKQRKKGEEKTSRSMMYRRMLSSIEAMRFPAGFQILKKLYSGVDFNTLPKPSPKVFIDASQVKPSRKDSKDTRSPQQILNAHLMNVWKTIPDRTIFDRLIFNKKFNETVILGPKRLFVFRKIVENPDRLGRILANSALVKGNAFVREKILQVLPRNLQSIQAPAFRRFINNPYVLNILLYEFERGDDQELRPNAKAVKKLKLLQCYARKYKDLVDELISLDFVHREANLRALIATSGNVEKAQEILLGVNALHL